MYHSLERLFSFIILRQALVNQLDKLQSQIFYYFQSIEYNNIYYIKNRTTVKCFLLIKTGSHIQCTIHITRQKIITKYSISFQLKFQKTLVITRSARGRVHPPFCLFPRKLHTALCPAGQKKAYFRLKTVSHDIGSLSRACPPPPPNISPGEYQRRRSVARRIGFRGTFGGL